MTVRTRIVRIGNSQGVRIPKPLLEQSGLEGEVELVMEAGSIVIRAVAEPRLGWDEAFADMAVQGDDELIDPELAGSVWDDEEWTW